MVNLNTSKFVFNEARPPIKRMLSFKSKTILTGFFSAFAATAHAAAICDAREILLPNPPPNLFTIT